jgi:hypothetical protein
MPEFEFPADLAPEPGKRVAVIEDVSGKVELLAALTSQLDLPDWFGNNWDALVDVLRDLSWVPEREVVLHHVNLPALSKDDLRIYLDILRRADRVVGLDGERRLVVSFAPDLEALTLHRPA